MVSILKIPMKNNYLLFCLLYVSFSFAQFSKTHYIPPISSASTQVPTGQSLYISCPSTTPVNFRIKALGGGITNGSVSRDLPFVLNIGNDSSSQIMVSQASIGSVLNNKGYIIEADDMIYATVRFSAQFHAGSIVSKGLAALGTNFRIGGFLNLGISAYNSNHCTFASILATENNTRVSFSDINTGASLINNAGVGNTPPAIILNSGESYTIAVQGPTAANRDALIGALISSDKPVAVNCGSVAGTNSLSANLDFGLDQIVSAERTGKEYILVKGNGDSFPDIESPLIIAHENNTEIFINGSTTAVSTLQAGEYLRLLGNEFSANRNLYIRASKNVFVYQAIGGSNTGSPGDQANQNMHFVPPLTCETPKIVNNIPLINEVSGNSNFLGSVMIVTGDGALLNFIINGTNYTTTTLPPGITITGPSSVIGNANYRTYRVNGLTGNVSIISSKQVYVSYFGSSGAATYGGFYSGFTFKPEISNAPIVATSSNCIPNVVLAVNSLSSFDAFQWFKDDVIIAGANANQFTPNAPGFYNVEAKITECGTTFLSDKIPVSSCASDNDNDGTNGNVDIDNDNDGLSNCTESLGNQPINFTSTAGTITIGAYNNPYTTTVSTTGTVTATPFAGAASGSFVSEVAAGKTNTVTQTVNFTSPISLSLQYPPTANNADLLNANGEFMLQVPVNKTITVLNPSDQLLIDTNYDGIYESGISSFSSFQIRFRLNNGGVPLASGTGTFKFVTNLVTTISYTHKNLSETSSNRATFSLVATCIPKDSDSDGIADQDDRDSDNDGISDIIENLGENYAVIPFVDVNKDGLNDAYAALVPLDSDSDGILNFLDLDADNDGIFDLVESGCTAPDANNNGIIDGGPAAFGTNGIFNGLETAPDSNIYNYTVANGDTDPKQNFIDLDSENDGCNDVFEVGYLDQNSDGILGNAPVAVDANGLVTSASGYTILTPLQSSNYTTGAPIIITTQPANTDGCEAGNTTFSVVTNGVSTHQWQLSTDGGTTFNNIANIAPYSGATTANLLITNVTMAMNSYKYQVFLTKTGNACNLTSSIATFTVLARPVVASQITIVQCDTDSDLIANFNLTQKNNVISAQSASQTFTYFTTQAGAIANNASVKINDPTAYNSPTGNTVWARVENANGCFNFSRINLIVSATQLPPNFSRTFSRCDDFLDAANNDYDGISKFDFSSVENVVLGVLPTTTGFSISYYRNIADFNAETNPISKNSADPISIYNYRNIGYANNQTIFIRVESTLTNSCFGDGKIFLIVEKLPVAHSVSVTRQCDDNPADANIESAFNTSNIQSAVLNGQSLSNVNVTYFDENNASLSSPLPNPFTTKTQLIRARVTNNAGTDPGGRCFDETLIQFTVDKKPVANAVIIAAACDRLLGDLPIDYEFNTSTINATLLGTQNAADFVITYFAQNGNPLSSPLPIAFLTATQTIKAVMTNPINPTCFAETAIQFRVNERPVVDSDTEDYFCDGTNNIKTIDAGLIAGNQADFNYQWFKDGIILPGETNYTYNVAISGIYTATVTDKLSGCFVTRRYKIIFSQKATITNISTTDLYDDNNTVIVTATGAGNYEYSMDEPQGPFQPTGIFTNISAGIHTVYVNDKNGCALASQEIAVVGIMPFFTPNGDSYNDLWKIRGVTSKYNKKSEVFIYDRFGKLLAQIPNGENKGWDGTYNGEVMPADDYWYTLVMEDGRALKGHFTLKR